ncbi:TPA: hypothetical protein N0F65_006175 [Lagenidium giganteum]|uniref:Uncharacterized protein n=1 Tax=Lagenidium giganteum TaxID=4803 RepID=A0AAV2ZCG8_9STRA|nr:TPA: hypothetical protein N0F65_006175 [Lagenidium giganteum]
MSTDVRDDKQSARKCALRGRTKGNQRRKSLLTLATSSLVSVWGALAVVVLAWLAFQHGLVPAKMSASPSVEVTNEPKVANAASSEKTTEKFIKWFTSHGGVIHNIGLQDFPGMGKGEFH